MAGDVLRRLWARLNNQRGEVITLPTDVQEKLSRLEKLEKDNAALGYRMRAWEKLGKEAGDVIEYDAQGIPMAFRYTAPATAPLPVTGSHPLSGVHENPQAVDAYYQALYTQQLNAAGYVTVKQAQEMASEAYQLARGDGQVWRTYDKLTAKPDYADLAKLESDLSKRTATILQERNLARPLPNAKGFDEWQYGDLGHLQFGADLARLQMHQEALTAAAAAASGHVNQNQAGLSVGPGAAAAPVPVSGEVPVTGGVVDWEKVRSDTESRAGQFGVKL